MKEKKFIKMPTINKIVFLSLLSFVCLFAFFFIGTCTWIGVGVQDACQMAQEHYQGDGVEALMSLVEDNNQPFSERNSAIWALGQLQDKRALPVLEKYYTGKIPDKEPLDESISQYELKKAINLLDDGFNASALVWRSFVRCE